MRYGRNCAGDPLIVGTLVLAMAWCNLAARNSRDINGYSPSGYDVTDLGTLGGAESYGNGINDSGQVVGRAQTAAGEWHAFLWHHGKMKDLGTLGGPTSEARAINGKGDVAGFSQLDKDPNKGHAFLYSRGTMRDLGSLVGASYATALNDRDDVVGSVGIASGKHDHHAFLYSDGKMKVLGTLGGRDSVAWAINNKGEIVGESHTDGIETWTSHAFLYRGHGLEDLGTPGRKI